MTVRIWGNVFGVTRRRQESHRWFIYAQWLIRPGFTPKSCTCVRARAYACARYRPRFTSYLRYRTAPRAGREKNFFPLSFPIIPSLLLRERSSSLERRKEKRIRSFFPFLFPQAVDEIRDEGEIGAVKGGVIWRSNYEKERRIIEIIAGN